MGAFSLRTAMVVWLLILGAASAIVQVFSGVLTVRWLPRFELGVGYGQVVFAVIGIFLEMLWWLLAFKLAVEALRAGAHGERQHSWRDNWIDDAQALHQLVLWGCVLFAGYWLYRGLGGPALALYGVLVVLLMPAVLVIFGMEDSINRAFDPRAWMELFEQAGVHYLVATAEAVGLALLAGAMQFELIPRDSGWLHGPLVRMAWLFALFVGYHELGRMLRRGAGTVAPRAVAAAAGPSQDLTEQEELAMRAAERLGADQRFARGARELQWLATRPGTSPLLHARFRELLALAGDEASLLVHARSYVAEMLSLGQDREAMALYLDSIAVDPHFELAEPVAVTRLHEVAVFERQLDLAIALAREYLRRFPDEPDAVPTGLSAARILDRQGHDEDARQLLANLARRFPQHPLRGELLAALETLENVARRGT